MSKIRKAVFPVAGLGARFLPATKAMPKELLPLNGRPNIEYILNGEILKTIETSTKQCNITARKLKSWHVDYVKFIPKNLRYASDEIIELMNKQLQINNQNLNQEK